MAKLKATTYEELSELLRPGQTRTIGNNTTAHRGANEETIYISLHHHLIAELCDDGSVFITTAGWDTVTTRERLNQFLPQGYRVHRNRGELSVTFPDGDVETWSGEWVKLRSTEVAER